MRALLAFASTFILVAAPALAGCAAHVDDAASTSRRQDELEFAGVSYEVSGFLFEAMGHGLNGTSPNGSLLDGRNVVYASLDGVRRFSSDVTDVVLDTTEFTGRVSGHKKISGKGFEGAELLATLDDGTTLPLRIDAIARSDRKADKEMSLYWLSYATSEGPKPLCGVGPDGAALSAIPLNGRPDVAIGSPGGGGWIDDDHAATFACRGFVIAKCVELGYKPWRKGKVCIHGQGCTSMTFASHHVACMRMLRADYCGDGQAHTVDGTEVNAYDAFGILLDAENWPLEAEWSAGGARCALAPRVGSQPLPSCWDSLQDETCGDVAHYQDGTLLMTEVPPDSP